jgi:hypothetical protein
MRVRLALIACAALLASASAADAQEPVPIPEGPTVPAPEPDQILLDEGGIKIGLVKLTVPRGCRRAPFAVTITGEGVTRVDFRVDGRLVSSVRTANAAGAFATRLNPRRLRPGAHKLRADVFFGHDNTADKTVKGTFRSCVRR